MKARPRSRPGKHRGATWRQIGVRRPVEQARTLTDMVQYRIDDRFDRWEKGVAEVDAELAQARKQAHPFTALKGSDYCLECGGTVEEIYHGKRVHRTV